MDDRLHDRLREVGDHWWYVGRRQIIEAELDRVVGPERPVNVLEVGCGPGTMLPVLARFGRPTAIEPDGGAVAYCRSTHGDIADIRQGSIPDDLPRRDDFDLVVAFDVLEHIEDDDSAAAAVHDRLRPGGLLVATVPAFPSLWGKQDVLSHHHRRYRRAGLRRVLEGAGLHVERLTYFNTFLFPPIAALRLARRALGRHDLDAVSVEEGGADFDAGPSGGLANRVLQRIFAAERHLLRRFDLPVGVSLLVVARRPRHDEA